jgi:hypothetical protein
MKKEKLPRMGDTKRVDQMYGKEKKSEIIVAIPANR